MDTASSSSVSPSAADPSVAALVAWVDAALAERGPQRSGESVVVVRQPWSLVLRVPTRDGVLYAKASPPRFACYAHEAPLAQLLATLAPDAVPSVLAVDVREHRLLLADGGDSLGARLRSSTATEFGRDVAAVARSLDLLAGLQVRSVAWVEALLAAGCPDHRLARLPTLYASLVAEVASVGADTPGTWTVAGNEAVDAFVPQLERICQRLGAVGVPATLHHTDFSPANVTACGDGVDAVQCIIDWGECAIGHPFGSAALALRWCGALLGWDAPTLAGLRDTYLAHWSAYAGPAALQESFALAARLLRLERALVWWYVAVNVIGDARAEMADSARYWLRYLVTDADPDADQ